MSDNKQDDLRQRTLDFAVRIIRLYTALPKTTEAQTIGKQVLRSGTSVGAHYHESRRSRSNAELVSKLEGGLQELDETNYWLRLLIVAEIMPESRLKDLMAEAGELGAILYTSVQKIKARMNNK